jgi:DNA-binding IclR family transcriptional regulator
VKTGAKDRVLESIRQGACDPVAIMAVTGLTRQQVHNALTRLQAAGDIRRRDLGGYAPAIAQCRLAEVWR